MSSSIFAAPVEQVNDAGLTTLFLHGLEGSPEGDKSIHLKEKWGGKTPALRTGQLLSLKSAYGDLDWQSLPKDKLNAAINVTYQDALAALNYCNPDVVIGSSMGGAILAKLIVEEHWNGPTVFLAPAIDTLLGFDFVLERVPSAVWLLGEFDQIVRNDLNKVRCLKTGGSLMISPEDSHRLPKALSSGLIDCAITTVLELNEVDI
jgi:hypothetical protein